MKKKLVYGIGIMDADYVTQKFVTIVDDNGKKKQKQVWICPFYRKWMDMLMRCYSEKYQGSRPAYKGCSVFEEWLSFSNFKRWMEQQDWEGKQLDKDILFQGNRVYSAETCVFVDQGVNKFLTNCNTTQGEHAIGVYWDKKYGKFQAKCCDGKGKQQYLGYFDSELEAHQAWLEYKLKIAMELAEKQTDPRVAEALINRYTTYGSSL